MPTGSTTRIETAWAAPVRRLGYIKWNGLCLYNTIKYKATLYTEQSVSHYIIGLY